MNFVTEFEKTLPLRQITLIEFERRLKKLCRPDMNDSITVRMMIECFEDHEAFKALKHKDSLAHDLLFNEMFMMEEEGFEWEEQRVSIERLMILAMLYCQSNRV